MLAQIPALLVLAYAAIHVLARLLYERVVEAELVTTPRPPTARHG
jgi:hypothetical protein